MGGLVQDMRDMRCGNSVVTLTWFLLSCSHMIEEKSRVPRYTFFLQNAFGQLERHRED